ncbi:thermonuclease family protein [candidate division WWE3 bacterium]|nr:thermonuclease family protein [candidate division WWE3 bacterium]
MIRRKLTRKQIKLITTLIAGAILTVIGILYPNANKPQSTSGQNEFVVTRVIDGDTFVIDTGQKIRLIGVDTPEIAKKTPPAECYANEAMLFTQKQLENKTIRLEKDVSETDKYGRLLRYAYLNDELFNQTLVEHGYALARSYPPDVAKQDVLQESEQSARTNNQGLWNPAVCPKQ